MATCAVNDKENGGAGSIAEQLVQTRPDVLLGGGKQYFDQTVKAGKYAGPDRRCSRRRRTATRSSPTRPACAAAKPNKPILGTFATNNMDLEWVGPTPTRTGTAPATCAANTARTATQPHLVDMATQGARRARQADPKHSRKGFFLQIEGASIDKQDHAANPCGQIGETVELRRGRQEGPATTRSRTRTPWSS